jgi:hypothetical protein
MKLNYINESYDFEFTSGPHKGVHINLQNIINSASKHNGQILNNRDFWELVFQKLTPYIPHNKLVEFFNITATQMQKHISGDNDNVDVDTIKRILKGIK